MKFLCFTCDEGMKLEATANPQEGALEATFICPRCRHKIVMMTNPWETQFVQSLGVKVGGRSSPVSPYEQVLGNLAQSQTSDHGPGNEGQNSPGCPFAEMFDGKSSDVQSTGIRWTEEASIRIERIPSFIRPMVQRAIERYAIEHGHLAINDAIMDEARTRLGM